MKIILKVIRFVFFILLVFTCYSIIIVVMLNWVNPHATAFMHSKSKDGLFLYKDNIEFEWKDIDEISPYFPLAVIASEDQNFFWHNGFDFTQIQKAMDEIKRGRRFRGASTITQQLAKNLFLWNNQSYFRKGIEAYFTILLETFLTKKRILEIYVNSVELGEDIYGIEAALKKYYNGSSNKMYPNQAALVAAILPNPLKRNPAKPTSYLIGRASTILRQMNLLGGIKFIEANLK